MVAFKTASRTVCSTIYDRYSNFGKMGKSSSLVAWNTYDEGYTSLGKIRCIYQLQYSTLSTGQCVILKMIGTLILAKLQFLSLQVFHTVSRTV